MTARPTEIECEVVVIPAPEVRRNGNRELVPAFREGTGRRQGQHEAETGAEFEKLPAG